MGTISRERKTELSRFFSQHPHTYAIIGEMFKRVGRRVENCAFLDGWYRKTSWSATDQLDFKKWMVGYFQKYPKAVLELTGKLSTMGIKNKAFQAKLIEKFLFQWGWKLHDPEQGDEGQ